MKRDMGSRLMPRWHRRVGKQQRPRECGAGGAPGSAPISEHEAGKMTVDMGFDAALLKQGISRTAWLHVRRRLRRF
jgi:hypothetical protein